MTPTLMVSVDELAALQLFEACPPGDLSSVAAAVTGTRRVPDGEVVCREGEQADRWWIVADGYADVTVAGLYAATIGPGESIGELALLDGEPRGATVTAVTDLVLHEVDGDAFRSALLDSPRVAVALLTQLAQRLRRANERPARPVVLPAAVPTAPAPRRRRPAERATARPDGPGVPRRSVRAPRRRSVTTRRATGPTRCTRGSSSGTTMCTGSCATERSSGRSRRSTRPMSSPVPAGRR